MELGEKLRAARLEAGLSQRQLCGEEITRNMLSQIENGTARPSMTTLRYLARRLDKPVSYFLEEDALSSPNRRVMDAAAAAWEREDAVEADRLLSEFRLPDPVYHREYALLRVLTRLRLAEKAIEEGRLPYAGQLLDGVEEQLGEMTYGLPELRRRAVLLRGRLSRKHAADLVRKLPSADEELMLRCRGALDEADLERAGQLLDAAEDRECPDWCLLRGEVYFRMGDFSRAAACLTRAEERYPRETALPLERCYREMGDYRKAYDYACRERSFRGK